MTDTASHILVVDDEQITRRTLKAILENNGYSVTAVDSGEAALDTLGRQAVDLMILDLKMGGMGGMQVLEQSLAAFPRLRVIVLTAFGSLETAIQAVRFHLSDYLLKPVTPDEIVASVRKALARRLAAEKGETVEEDAYNELDFQTTARIADEIEIDFSKRRIAWSSSLIPLTPTEARLLDVLYRRRNQVVPHSELVSLVHGYRVETEEAAKILRPVMSRLRRKLAEIPAGEKWIQNVRGAGYLLEVE